MIAEVSMIWGHYTNLIGVILCIIVAFGSKWRFREKNKENVFLLCLLLCVVLSCIADSIAIWADGRSGELIRLVVYASNSWLYAACILSGILWIKFMEEHIHGENSPFHLGVLQVISIIGLIILVINLYIPIVFAVNRNNVYERRGLFFLYFTIEVCFLVDSFYMYASAKYKFGGLSVFQIWLYIVPQIIGMWAQLLVYGTSLIWPSTAVATALLFIQFNIEDKYRDNVSRLYKKDYLKVLNDKLKHGRNKEYTIVGVQVLGLAGILSTKGDESEKRARQSVVSILKKRIKPQGVIIQYDADFYAIVFNTVDKSVTEQYIEKLENEFTELNILNKSEYSLTTEYGYRVVNIMENDIETVVQQIKDSM